MSGANLYVGGRFSTAGGNPIRNFAQAAIDVFLPQPPQLEWLGFNGSEVRLRVSGRAGGTIAIEAGADLVMWESVTEVTLGMEPMEVSDPGAEGNQMRLYRAVDTGN